MGLDVLEFKLKKLFICADSMENLAHQYDMSDLFYSLLDEVEQLKGVYEVCKQELLDKA